MNFLWLGTFPPFLFPLLFFTPIPMTNDSTKWLLSTEWVFETSVKFPSLLKEAAIWDSGWFWPQSEGDFRLLLPLTRRLGKLEVAPVTECVGFDAKFRIFSITHAMLKGITKLSVYEAKMRYCLCWKCNPGIFPKSWVWCVWLKLSA